METKICAGCGEQIGEDEWFCPFCSYGLGESDGEVGELADADEEENYECPACGEPIEPEDVDDSGVCPKCGATLIRCKMCTHIIANPKTKTGYCDDSICVAARKRVGEKEKDPAEEEKVSPVIL